MPIADNGDGHWGDVASGPDATEPTLSWTSTSLLGSFRWRPDKRISSKGTGVASAAAHKHKLHSFADSPPKFLDQSSGPWLWLPPSILARLSRGLLSCPTPTLAITSASTTFPPAKKPSKHPQSPFHTTSKMGGQSREGTSLPLPPPLFVSISTNTVNRNRRQSQAPQGPQEPPQPSCIPTTTTKDQRLTHNPNRLPRSKTRTLTTKTRPSTRSSAPVRHQQPIRIPIQPLSNQTKTNRREGQEGTRGQGRRQGPSGEFLARPFTAFDPWTLTAHPEHRHPGHQEVRQEMMEH